MSDVKRFKMPWHDSPLDWPRELRKPGTEVVLASDYDVLRAKVEALRPDAEHYGPLTCDHVHRKSLTVNRGQFEVCEVCCRAEFRPRLGTTGQPPEGQT